jgi:hypothetical protein
MHDHRSAARVGFQEKRKNRGFEGLGVAQMVISHLSCTDVRSSKGVSKLAEKINLVVCELLCRQKTAHTKDMTRLHESDPFLDLGVVYRFRTIARALCTMNDGLIGTSRCKPEAIHHRRPHMSFQHELRRWIIFRKHRMLRLSTSSTSGGPCGFHLLRPANSGLIGWSISRIGDRPSASQPR